jgi:hypothetical protein
VQIEAGHGPTIAKRAAAGRRANPLARPASGTHRHHLGHNRITTVRRVD